jgi:uncharacterized protein YndB with AHSA1/START domain
MTNALTVTAPEGMPYIDTAREFDAPVDAVFRAHRDPDLLRQWMGPDGYEMEIERHDFVTQGGYRFVHRNPEGEEYAFNGVFHTVRDDEFAIQTFEYEGFPDVVSIESLTFVDLGDGRTKLSGHSVFPTVEARDGMAASGMEDGMSQGYDKLETLAAKLP